jgi:hypothetical protein
LPPCGARVIQWKKNPEHGFRFPVFRRILYPD